MKDPTTAVAAGSLLASISLEQINTLCGIAVALAGLGYTVHRWIRMARKP